MAIVRPFFCELKSQTPAIQKADAAVLPKLRVADQPERLLTANTDKGGKIVLQPRLCTLRTYGSDDRVGVIRNGGGGGGGGGDEVSRFFGTLSEYIESSKKSQDFEIISGRLAMIGTWLGTIVAGVHQADAREAQLKSEVAMLQGQLNARNEGLQKTLEEAQEQLKRAQELAKEKQTDFERRMKRAEEDLNRTVGERDQALTDRNQFAELLTASENKFSEKVTELSEVQGKLDEAQAKIVADAADVHARIASAVALEKKSTTYLAEAKACYVQGLNHMSRCVLRAADENIVLTLQGLAEAATTDGYIPELRRYHAVVPYPASEIKEYNEEAVEQGLPLLDDLPEVQQPNFTTIREAIEEQREREYQEALLKMQEEEAARLAAASSEARGDGDTQA